MARIDEIIKTIFALFIAVLFGYIFALVFWQLNQAVAVLFLICVGIVVVGMLFRIFRR